MGKYKFGPYEAEDVIQEARMYGIKAMAKYDGVRPLENFLSNDMRKKLINLKRNKYKRVECPCQLCVKFPTKHKDGKYCAKYIQWEKRNERKQALNSTAEIYESPTKETDYDDEIDMREMIERIEREMPQRLRSTYLKMKAQVFVNPKRRLEVETFIRELYGSQISEA